MSRRLQASLLAATVALSPIPLIATTAPAAAQVNISVNIGFDYFHNGLSPYGDWYYHPRWGDVWRPVRVSRDFRPYFRGYWVNTEFGWTWESDEPWGDITYHYGRWVYDPFDGWMWVPGYTWAPAWVVWRGDGRNIGWFPMPPDDRFLIGVEIYRSDWDWGRGYFGYADWYGPSIATSLFAAWTFVTLDHFADRDYYRYVPPRTQVINIVNNTTNITNYVTVNNRIVNRSIDVTQVERAAGRRIERVQAERIVRAPITTVETGRQVQVRERERHGGDVRAQARERVQRLPAQEARLPVRERRSVQLRRDDQQQAQPQAPLPPDAERGGRFERGQQRDQKAGEPRGRIDRDRDRRGEIEQQQPDRGAALQQQRERDAAAQRDAEQQQRAAQQRDEQRARIEQQDRARAEQQDRARAEQQNRAAIERQQQQRDRAEQDRAARVEPQNRARDEQAARAQPAERQEQQQGTAEQRQQQARAKQQKEEEEKQRRGRN
jgi:hypothetical protein